MAKKSPSSDDINTDLNHYGGGEDFLDPLDAISNETKGPARSDGNVLLNSQGDEEEGSMSKSTPTSYKDEWIRLFECKHFESFLQKEAIKGKLRNCRFRSLCWGVFLKCLSTNVSNWSAEVRDCRHKYRDIRHRLLSSPETELKDESIDIALNNPLSQSQDSPWQRFFTDKELKSEIQLDVDRCFPDMALFQTPAIKDMMLSILFCYAKEHPNTEYKQGMHELLAPFIFILHSDQQAYLHAREMESLLYCECLLPLSSLANLIAVYASPMCLLTLGSQEADTLMTLPRPLVNEMLDPNFLEHDSYTMFSHLMTSMAPWYEYGRVDTRIKKPKDLYSKPFSGGGEEEELLPTTPLANKIMAIHDTILKKKDYELYSHLAKLDIPHVYGVRWIRLLFGREFMFQDLLVLWDALFADSAELKLIDYVFVGMLMLIEELLLRADHLECLNLLMHFPTTEDIQFLINKALHLRDPLTHSRPANYQFQIFHQSKTGSYMAHTLPRRRTPQPSSFRQGLGPARREKHNLGAKTNSAVTSGFNSLKRITSTTLGTRNSTKEEKPSRMVKSNTCGDLPHPLSTSSKENIVVESRPLPRKANTTPSSPVLSAARSTKSDSYFGKPRSNSHTSPAREGSHELTALRSRMNDTQNMCKYCATKMEAHILQIQDALECHKLPEEGSLLMALAGLKQVKDILSGTLKFAEGSSDSDDININDNYFSEDRGTELSIKHFDSSRETFLTGEDQQIGDTQEGVPQSVNNGHVTGGSRSEGMGADQLGAN